MSDISMKQEQSFFFDDPRFHMTIFGRMFVRIVAAITYLVLFVLAGVLIASQLPWMRWWGLLLGVFLIDRFVFWRHSDRLISELSRGGAVNIAPVVSPRAFALVERAWDKSFLQESDLCLELCKQLFQLPEIRQATQRLDLDVQELSQKLEEFLSKSIQEKENKQDEQARFVQIESVFVEAFTWADAARHEYIQSADVLCALVDANAWTKRLFGLFSLTSEDFVKAFVFGAAKKGVFARSHVGRLLAPRTLKHHIINRAWTSRITPTLDKYSYDFTDLARRDMIGLLIGHEAEYERLVDTLSRPLNPNTLLIGEEGSGRNTLVQHLALDVVNDKVPPALFDKRVVALEINALVAGATGEELASRITALSQEIITAGNIILYIPDMHNLAKTTSSAYLSAADSLMPIIKSDAFPIIGATYPREFKEFLEKRSDIIGSFEIIRVEEIKEPQAQELLIYEALALEDEFKVTISFGAIKEAVIIAKKYFHTKMLPSSAAELLKEALVAVKRKGNKVLGVADIIQIAEAKVNIPIHRVQAAEAETLLNLEEIIHKQFIDQEEAVKGVAQSLREYRSGLNRPGGPIASFLFVGPTGVGKTELAKVVTKLQFGSEQLMVRFDMSEYQDKQSFYRFIGSPDQQIPGLLTEAVLQKPYSLILLDEFEKAHPDILNLFLQVLDDGRLTDNLGRVVDFQNTIIIATSNAHSDLINQALNQGETMTNIAEYLKKRLSDVYKPELLNRFSRIIIFKNLEPQHLIKIAQMNLQEVVNVLAQQGIDLTIDPAAIERIAKLGYDPVFGARPLRQVIEDKVRAPLSEELLKKNIGHGSRVLLRVQGDTFEFVPLQ